MGKERIMNIQRNIHKLLNMDLERCEILYEDMRRQLKELPEGSITNRHGELCRFVREGGRQFLIPIREDARLVRELKQRRITKKGIRFLEKRIRTTKHYLDNEVIYDPRKIEAALPSHYRGLQGINVFLEGDVNAEDWLDMEYETNPMDFFNPQYTAGGVKCRSKSEALIGSRLEKLGIPYHYEPMLKLGNAIVYPDFEILDEDMRRIIYLEHFGMIDDPEYAEKCFRKLDLYQQNGYYLGINFFFTYETRRSPLTMKAIDRKISEIMNSKW